MLLAALLLWGWSWSVVVVVRSSDRLDDDQENIVSSTTSVTGESDHLITLNSTQNATLYCFSDFIPRIRLITNHCKTCEDEKNCTWDDESCFEECEHICNEYRGDTGCPNIPGEYSSCLNIRSSEEPTRYHCMGYTRYGDKLQVSIDVIRHRGPRTCFGGNAGIPVTEGSRSPRVTTNVTYKAPIWCVNSSKVMNLNAGHLLSAGYTVGKAVRDDHLLEHEEDRPAFKSFCEIVKPELWTGTFRLGTVFRCNGSYRILEDEFPCLQFSPDSRLEGFGVPVPSLEHCSQMEMVGVVLGMIVMMIMCYAIFILCVRIWKSFCKCARKDMREELPLAQHSSHSRLTHSDSLYVVKQESSNSILSKQSDQTQKPSASPSKPPVPHAV